MSLASTWRKTESRYRLIGIQCETCKGKYFPPRSICPICRRKGKISEFSFSGNGKVYSYTFITSASTGYEKQAPYIFAIIELKEGPKISAQITDAKPEEITIGTPVKMSLRKIKEDGAGGIIYYGYKFVVDNG
ncbi:transcriptional regulator [Candidatus Micrarchaeota archaeon CG08_land_8_20_14_0_20_49_17]|nr:MAG: transcriptional regulator [Candidatus Micrarchaeota archaeon CG1_02_49_24]PIU10117.1 MAG: transcriptional regulator [Candidatus Micrarchaeota archaeon CG08_land_8_20_14_0_20_49_17]PIU81495.1 MAG: transcriptional regulator [Candidatus Micrarchaeota archaeon CG06_land_8_20_14_3_00_50_6]PIZ92768.1 MAG: transcriptional regulator [Candidatus Micrarchaeota archaeon CG_4_10_14_0_2_um_filter_49_7]HII53742.1 Zn-ribbon domain-containing OB-fold protein [Candidatus Micrarchaeota archaeon]